ncbi:FUSC family protein [Gordonia sp. LSe1-13]|uniref:FUSC family protein n=1 Tax=Gordonia sesuvii TaxID=3116777 RepID=A0ABU7M898_9ACTN|nr:FUSC family protein [Gordonia sp. LSe1-13]
MSTDLVGHARQRRTALTLALRPSVWRSALVADVDRLALAAPVRVGVAVGSTLVVGGLLGHHGVAGLAALGALVAAFCRTAPYRVRAERLTALGIGIVASVAIGAVLGLTAAPLTVEIATLSLLGGLVALGVAALQVTGPGAVVFVFAATAATVFTRDAADLAVAVAATSLGAVAGVVASLAPDLWRRVRGRPDTNAPHESSWVILVRRPPVDLLNNSVRIVGATALSAAIAAWVGFAHPMWAALGALAAMQGLSYHLTVQRGVQRLLGSAVGALIGAGLLMSGVGYWGSVAAIVACLITAEIWAPVNYAVTSMAVTPMALLLTALGAGLSADAAVDRVADTLIGVVVGVVVAALTISTDEHPGGTRSTREDSAAADNT